MEELNKKWGKEANNDVQQYKQKSKNKKKNVQLNEPIQDGPWDYIF
jgi:hypothetical protein